MADIKNIVLDIGNVLGHFCWEKVFTDIMGIKGEEFERLADCTVRSDMWSELDKSLLSDEQVMENCIKLDKSQEKNIREFFTHLGEVVIDFDYSRKWINELKQEGFKVYILSNYGKTSFTSCRERGNLSFIEDVDGAVISYEVKLCKPDVEIYEALLSKYDLKAEECLFFDDLIKNVEGARKAGMKAKLFTTYEAAREVIAGINISE
ncbi:MAG: HAD family phosphatase [Lachnospiraceae bacterium]|nr:HAD family phosphatase [Lachnospiraceae bacterium]